MKGTNYKVYDTGEVVHEDDFDTRDASVDDDTQEMFLLCFIPDAILEYLKVEEENPKCSFCGKTKKEAGTPIIEGKNANICYGCIAINKKKLEEGQNAK